VNLVIDPTGTIVTLLATDMAVIAIAGGKVRGGEPAQGDRPPMVVVSRISTTRNPGGGGNRRTGLQELLLQLKCWGATPMQAAQLRGACSDVLHMHRPFVDPLGRLLFTIADDVGGSAGMDPDTRWPYEDVTIRVIAGAD
jgi:hypothetical protein